MKKAILLFFLFLTTFFSFSQEKNAWKLIEKKVESSKGKYRKTTLPSKYSLFEFDYNRFSITLTNVPNRDSHTGVSNVIVYLPMPKRI